MDVRGGTQGCRLRLETAPVFLGRIRITGEELGKPREDRRSVREGMVLTYCSLYLATGSLLDFFLRSARRTFSSLT